MKLILLGAPGAGKGTQAEIVCDKLNIPAISTGNILREAMKNETEMGVKAKAFIDSGALVPDDVIIGIIKERLAQDDCKNGFILDGVPRTVAQAEALEEMGVGIDKVVDIEVSDERIIQRLSGRRVCSACGASYHTTAKPSVKPDVCDRCGGALIVAHPMQNLKLDEAAAEALREGGVDGFEVYSSYHDARGRQFYHEFCRRWGLAETFGSDFHGATKPNIVLGKTGFDGDCTESVTLLKERIAYWR